MTDRLLFPRLTAALGDAPRAAFVQTELGRTALPEEAVDCAVSVLRGLSPGDPREAAAISLLAAAASLGNLGLWEMERDVAARLAGSFPECFREVRRRILWQESTPLTGMHRELEHRIETAAARGLPMSLRAAAVRWRFFLQELPAASRERPGPLHTTGERWFVRETSLPADARLLASGGWISGIFRIEDPFGRRSGASERFRELEACSLRLLGADAEQRFAAVRFPGLRVFRADEDIPAKEVFVPWRGGAGVRLPADLPLALLDALCAGIERAARRQETVPEIEVQGLRAVCLRADDFALEARDWRGLVRRKVLPATGGVPEGTVRLETHSGARVPLPLVTRTGFFPQEAWVRLLEGRGRECLRAVL